MRGKIGLRFFETPGGGITVSGTIRWEHNNAAIANVLVTLSGDASATTTTAADGTYSITVPSGANFVITPTKNRTVASGGALNGVTAADSSRIGQHVSGTLVFTTAGKMIAADVNNSRSVTGADQSVITSALGGNPVNQAFFVNRTWVFYPSDHTFPAFPWAIPFDTYPTSKSLTTGTHTGVDFVGAKLGDVNGTANPAGA